MFITPAGNVPDDPVKTVSSETASIGDTITYTITQDISESSQYIDFYYESLIFSDSLPIGVTYTSLKAYDSSGTDVTSTARYC